MPPVRVQALESSAFLGRYGAFPTGDELCQCALLCPLHAPLSPMLGKADEKRSPDLGWGRSGRANSGDGSDTGATG